MRTKVIHGADGSPYLTRTYALDLGPMGQILLHRMHRADMDEEQHDHPWSFLSLVVRGWYVEELGGCRKHIHRRRGSLAFRQAAIPHRIIAMPEEGCITLLWVGAKKREREWGFYTAKGWVPWRQFFGM